MRGEPKVPFQWVDIAPPSLDNGQTVFFTDPSSKGLCRKTFDHPRPMIAYAFWDPYKNNPTIAAALSTRLAPGGTQFMALGRLKIGNQGTMIEVNFDLPWGQLVAIPITAEQVEVSGYLIDPVPSSDAFDYQKFNDPPALIIPPGFTLPNPSVQFPTGFVAITGGIGVGNAGPTSAAPPTRSQHIISLAASPAPGSTVFVALAWGARRVTILGDPTTTMAFFDGSGGSIPIPFNVKTPLPILVSQIALVNSGAAPTGAFEIIYELGV